MKKLQLSWIISFILYASYSIILTPLAFAGPQSTNYELKTWGFGAGGTSGQTSSSYGLNGIAGETEGGKQSSTNYSVGSGLSYTQLSYTPAAPTVTNPSNAYYNKLHVVIDNGNNPSDTTFLIAASPDNFTTTYYVHPDQTISTTYATTDWQLYSAWNSATGFDVIGLTPGTTYSFKVQAKQGSNYTISPWSAVATAATVNPTMSFSLSPSSISSWSLTPGSVGTAPSTATVTITTNAYNGANVYVYDSKNGLQSTTAGHTINSVSNDLTAIGEGYGIRSTSVSNGMQADPPYNDANSTTVGLLDSTKRLIYDTNGTAATSATGAFQLKAKPSTTAPPGSDYTDTITIISAAGF